MRILPVIFLMACSNSFGESYDIAFESYVADEPDSLSFSLVPNEGFAQVSIEFTTSELEDMWSPVVWTKYDSDAMTVVMYDAPDTGWISVRGFGNGDDGEAQFCEVNDYNGEVYPIGWWNIAIQKDDVLSEWQLSQTVFTDGVCTMTYSWYVAGTN